MKNIISALTGKKAMYTVLCIFLYIVIDKCDKVM